MIDSWKRRGWREESNLSTFDLGATDRTCRDATRMNAIAGGLRNSVKKSKFSDLSPPLSYLNQMIMVGGIT